MKRDFDLIRKLLLDIEKSGGLNFRKAEDGAEVLYQLTILDEAEMIKASFDKTGALVQRLTWQGHDFLDAVRDDTVWKKTQEKVVRTVGSASLEVLKGVAEAVTKSLLGLG